MKRILLLTPVLLFSQIAFSQFEITAGYSMAIPRGKMNEYINLAHSLTVQGNYRMPFAKQLWAGAQLGYGVYATKAERQTYSFSNGSVTETNVNFSSNIFNGHAVIGYDFIKTGKIVPYITAKAGISNFFTRVYIEDPHDPDGCRPLENKNLFGDVTFSGGAGIGARLDGEKMFKSRRNNWAIDISVNYLTGGTLDYLNVRHLHNDVPTTDVKKEFLVKFVNVSTNEIHEHRVAEVYTSKLKQLDIRVGFTFLL